MKTFLAFAFSLAMAGAAQAQGMVHVYADLPPDLAQAASAYDEAQLKGDGAALHQLLAKDYRLIGGSGAVENKAQFIADNTDPKFHLLPFTIMEPIHTLWENGAVLGGLVDFRFEMDGKPGEQWFRFADIWAKRGGRWTVVYTQVTRVLKK